ASAGEDGGRPERAPPGPAEGPPFLLGQAAPDARVLDGLHGPLQALEAHGTPTADGFGRLDLGCGRAGVADGEEELRILVLAQRSLHPVHDCPNRPSKGSLFRRSRSLPETKGQKVAQVY